jgi:orotate phosphoribosyltransferase
MIRAVGAEPAGIAMALDRQERGRGSLSAVQEVHSEFGIPCVSIATLADLLDYLQAQPLGNVDIDAIRRYRDEYGV